MAESGKIIIRPKVRFCQTDDNEYDQKFNENRKISSPPKKPSIRNIVTIENPYRIISIDDYPASKNSQNDREEFSQKSFESTVNNSEDRGKLLSTTDNVYKNFDDDFRIGNSIRKYPFSPSMERSEQLQTPSTSPNSSFSSKEDTFKDPEIVHVNVHSDDHMNEDSVNEDIETGNSPANSSVTVNNRDEEIKKIQPETRIILDEASMRRDVINEPFISISPQSENLMTENILSSPKKKNLSTIQEESPECEIVEQGNSPNLKTFGSTKNLNPESKHRATSKPPSKTFKCPSPLKRQLNSVNRLSKAKKPLKKSNLEGDSKNPRLSGPNTKLQTIRPLGFLPKVKARPKVVGVMPCMKAKVAAKNKSSPVKKRILRNIIAPSTKVSVERGNIKPKVEFEVNLEQKPSTQSKILSADRLSKPEYNSIMCTIDKLNKIQKENKITSVEQLPPSYKSLLHGKVSGSLDFPPDKAIFKNLINLSIEESELPARITRTKDPEPRQRDAVPKLSDFFIPKYSEEYFTVVSVQPRISETVINWDPYKISNKIRGWKRNLEIMD